MFQPRRERRILESDKTKEMSKTDSYKKVQDLLKNQETLSRAKMTPGNLIFTSYDAKDKTQTYDKTPLVLVLARSRGYTLGINFHWLPVSHRIYLINTILKMNERNIKRSRPLEFSYNDLKPMLKSLGYAPCIRLYINTRFAKRGVVIPPERLLEVSRLKAETFTRGKYSAAQLFSMARRRGNLRN